jgi:exopolysaccharide production protein ExoQ
MTRKNNWLVDRSESVSDSTAAPFLVGAFFSFRPFIMLLSVRLFGTDPQTGTGISLAINFLFLLLIAFQNLGAAGPSLISFLRLPPIRWVLLFLAFSCLSLSWTEAASQFSATGYWCAMTADAAIVALLFRANSTPEVIHSLLKGYVWGACALAIVAWLLPTQSDLRLGDEELLGSNQIGYICGFAFFLAQYLVRERVGRFSFAAILLGTTLLRSLSKTTIAAFLVAEAFLLLRDKSMSRKTKLSLVAAGALVTVLFSGLLVSYFDTYSNTGNNPETLTGRLTIWAVILDEAIKQPWIGHGFYSVWKVIPPFGEFEARHAHNELLQQFYLYGVIGIVMMFGLYGSFFWHARRASNGPRKTFFTSLMIFILIRGLADTEVYDLSLPLWAIVSFSLLFTGVPAASSQDASTSLAITYTQPLNGSESLP